VGNVDVYIDPSALSLLFLHQEGSREIAAWRRRHSGPLPVTHHGRTEIVNAIAVAVFRGEIDISEAEQAWGWIDSEFANGRFFQADILWRAALDRSSELSRQFSPTLGTRSLDVLHVACALELRLKKFLTFDMRQGELATSAGLKPIILER
jgi:predicted nucleic acid-binding protein